MGVIRAVAWLRVLQPLGSAASVPDVSPCLPPTALPKAPGTPVVTENTATSITITWDSGNPDPVSYYVIEYKSKSQDGPYQIKEDITTTRYSIGGLSPNSEYEIWVSAVNSIGQGPPQ